MPNLANTAKVRYETALRSDSDREFYLNTHNYIDFIVKTPVLAEIMDKSAREYAVKHREIWGTKPLATDREADEKEEQTHRLETFSLYARDYAFLHTRIYKYIEEYKNHTEPDERPYPAAIVMLRGVNGIETELWSKEALERYGKWYTGKRESYEDRLRKFHNDFLQEVEKIKEPEVEQKENPKPIIVIDDKRGIYQKGNEQSAYGMKKNSKRFEIIRHLFAKDHCSVSELARASKQTNHVTMKAISDINRLFRKNVGQAHDLISHTDTVGYFLNKEKFEIEKALNL